MVLVYEVDGLDGVDKSKGTGGFNGHQRIKGYNGQRDSVISLKNSVCVEKSEVCVSRIK